MERKRVGIGQSGIVWTIAGSSTATKSPFQDTVEDIEFERSVYEKLGHHPRVAKYLGPKSSGIEFKFYEGGNVDSKLVDPEFDIPLIKWADQITEGLIFIHGKGIVHGDLRGANILLDNLLDLVLVDFGSAAIDGIKGTTISYDTRHCAPDFHDPNHEITAQDDLFAFGTVLYHLSTRKMPYDDRTKEEVARLYKNGDFPDLSDLEMGHIIERCWRRLYTSAAEIQTDIKQLYPSRTSNNSSSYFVPSLVAISIPIVFFGCARLLAWFVAKSYRSKIK